MEVFCRKNARWSRKNKQYMIFVIVKLSQQEKHLKLPLSLSEICYNYLKFHFDIPMDWFCCFRGQLWLIALLDVLLARFPFFACIRLVFANTRQVSLSNNVLNHCEIVRLFLFFFLFIKGYLEYFPSRRLFVHNQQCENKTRPIWRLLKVKNKDTRTASMTSLWCLYY